MGGHADVLSRYVIGGELTLLLVCVIYVLSKSGDDGSEHAIWAADLPSPSFT